MSAPLSSILRTRSRTSQTETHVTLFDRLDGFAEHVAGCRPISAYEPRKQKNDRRDAKLLLDLLIDKRFPQIWMPSSERRDLRALLRYRHQWVRVRSRLQHRLQSIALNHGLRMGSSLWSKAGLEALFALPLEKYAAQRRESLIHLYRQLEDDIEALDKQVSAVAEDRAKARLLMTHPGVGPITANTERCTERAESSSGEHMSTKPKLEDHSVDALAYPRAHKKPNPLVDRAAFVRDVVGKCYLIRLGFGH